MKYYDVNQVVVYKSDVHSVGGVGICYDSRDGTCYVCGVYMTLCLHCSGIGYHYLDCVELDE